MTVYGAFIQLTSSCLRLLLLFFCLFLLVLLLLPFYSVLASISVFMPVSTILHSINSPDNSLFLTLKLKLNFLLLLFSAYFFFFFTSSAYFCFFFIFFLFTLFLYLFLSLWPFSTVLHPINSPDNSLLSHSVLPVLFLPYLSFQIYISS